jgi:hypothetical protein
MIVRQRSTSVTVNPDFNATQSRHVGRSNSNSAITEEGSGIVAPHCQGESVSE